MSASINIVVLAYNRPRSLARILDSIARAKYPTAEIKLYISIDGGGPNGVTEIAEDFHWKHGAKEIIKRDARVGMKVHAFECLQLIGGDEYLIFLEEDSIVGPYFYYFALYSSDIMSSQSEIFAASLYAFDLCEFDSLKFSPVLTGEYCYLVKSATTWGVVFSAKRWGEFQDWYHEKGSEGEGARFVPAGVNNWPMTSWKKYVNRYLSESASFYLYPYSSHLTHFADPGEHFGEQWNNYQVPVTVGPEVRLDSSDFRMENAARYDEFWEMMPTQSLLDSLGSDFEFDLRRIKETSQYRKDHVVTSRSARRKIRSFSASIFPLEYNILYELDGEDLSYAMSQDIDRAYKSQSSSEIRSYMKHLGLRRELHLVKSSIVDRLRHSMGKYFGRK